MGAALDSFVMIFGYSGFVALILLVFCLFTRFRNDTGKLAVYQRMPLLLPAIGFVLTVIVINGSGILPMAQYQGTNQRSYYFESGQNTSFTLRDNEFYSHSLKVEGNYHLEFNESIHIDVSISLNGDLLETLHYNLQYTPGQNTITTDDTLPLNPGIYNVQVDFTRYLGGGIDENQWDVSMAFSQPLVDGYIEELVDWSSYQFITNITCIGIFLAGLCIGSSQERGPRREEPESEREWKPSSKYEY